MYEFTSNILIPFYKRLIITDISQKHATDKSINEPTKDPLIDKSHKKT